MLTIAVARMLASTMKGGTWPGFLLMSKSRRKEERLLGGVRVMILMDEVGAVRR
jgi:hypothetical protein